MNHEAASTRSLPAQAVSAVSLSARPQRRLEDLHGAEVFAVIASAAVILIGLLGA